jgi:branched-chain amino acid transport system ATP-binding protein
MALLEVERLDSFYGDFQALFDVSLSVAEGETVAIIGANGAGKSTLLKNIAGLLRTPPATVRLAGQPIGQRRADERVRLGISLVPEGRRIFGSLSVEENLLLGGHTRRPGGWDLHKVYALFPRLAERRRHRGTALSGGEQQMLAIGRALMANPRLLLLDEISLGLAPIVVRQLYESLPGVAAGGGTILLVEQDVSRACQVADRVSCLLEGKVSLTARPAEVTLDQIRAAYFGAKLAVG